MHRKSIDKKSGFAYQPGGHPEYTTTARGLLAMQVCGQYESPFVLGAKADWLLDNAPKTNRKFFFYGTYYYAQAMYQLDEEHADIARGLVEEILLPMQKENGAWQGVVPSQEPVRYIVLLWPCWHLQ